MSKYVTKGKKKANESTKAKPAVSNPDSHPRPHPRPWSQPAPEPIVLDDKDDTEDDKDTDNNNNNNDGLQNKASVTGPGSSNNTGDTTQVFKIIRINFNT